MSHPKHRHSKARGRLRRTHYKAEPISSTKCDKCGQPKRPHHVCEACGFYNGVQVKRIETLEQRKERREAKQKQA